MPRGRGRLLQLATAVLAAGAALASCLDRPDLEELLREPVIVTKRDPTADFSSFATFAMTGSIALVTSLDAGPNGMTVEPALAAPTLEAIAAHLSSRGYRQVARTEGPDLGVAVTAVNQLRTVSVVYGGWWGAGAASAGYWGFVGVPFSTPMSYATAAWQSGTLVLELYDLRAARDAARRSSVAPSFAAPSSGITITVIWAAFIHGVVGGPGASLDAPPLDAIQQAFTQSPYLARPSAPSEVP